TGQRIISRLGGNGCDTECGGRASKYLRISDLQETILPKNRPGVGIDGIKTVMHRRSQEHILNTLGRTGGNVYVRFGKDLGIELAIKRWRETFSKGCRSDVRRS